MLRDSVVDHARPDRVPELVRLEAIHPTHSIANMLLEGKAVERSHDGLFLVWPSFCIWKEQRRLLPPSLPHHLLLFLNDGHYFPRDGNAVLFFHFVLVVAQKPVSSGILCQTL